MFDRSPSRVRVLALVLSLGALVAAGCSATPGQVQHEGDALAVTTAHAFKDVHAAVALVVRQEDLIRSGPTVGGQGARVIELRNLAGEVLRVELAPVGANTTRLRVGPADDPADESRARKFLDLVLAKLI